MMKAFDICLKNRENLVRFMETLSTKQVNTIPAKFNNNIIWNIMHTISVQQGLIYGLSNLDFKVDKELVKNYTRGTTPESHVSEEVIAEVKTLLIATVEGTRADYNVGKFKEFREYQVGLGTTISSVEDAINFNNYHEGLHLGVVMALRKLV